MLEQEVLSGFVHQYTVVVIKRDTATEVGVPATEDVLAVTGRVHPQVLHNISCHSSIGGVGS